MRSRACVAMLLAWLAGAPRASEAAAPPEPAAHEVALSREQFRNGLAAAEAGRWDEARDAFARAYALNPRPLILLNLASAEASSARLVQAAEHYRRFVREAADAQTRAKVPAAEQALADLEPRIPHLRVDARGLLADDVVSLDGRPLPRAALGAPAPVDPGAHEVRVERAGQRIAAAEVTLAERERRDVELTVPPPTPRAEAVPSIATAPAAEPERPRWWRSRWTWAAAGVLVAVGVVVGVLATRSQPAPFAGNATPGTLTVR